MGTVIGEEVGTYPRGQEDGYLDDRSVCYVVALVVGDSNHTYKFVIYAYKLGIFNLKLPMSSCE